MSKRESDGYEHKFKRRVSWDMTHPKQDWNTTEYKVMRSDSNE